MRGDPSRRHPDPYGRDLLAPRPDARRPFVALALDAEGAERADQHRFEAAKVGVKVLAVGFEVQDGIAYELAGAVVGDVASAPCLVDADPPGGELAGGEQQVAAPAGRPEGDDVGVLQEQQGVGDPALPALFDQGGLHLQGRGGTRPARDT